MKETRKIELLTILSLICLVFSFVISLVIACFVATMIEKTAIQIIVVFSILIGGFILLSISVYLIYKLVRKHIVIEKPYTLLKCSNDVLESAKQISIEINSHAVYITKKRKNLKIITFFENSDLIDYENIKQEIKKTRKVIKEKYALPKNPSPADEHLMIDVSVFVVDKATEEDLLNLFSKANDKNFEIGRFFAVFEKDTNGLYCPIYFGKALNFVAFLGYKKCQKMLFKIFNS